MANKMTAVSQDVVINLKAHTSEMESSVKALIQKLQGANLSDAFTKSSISSLQKVLDKSQELKKIIGETNSVNSKTVADWGNSYNKLTTELTKMIAKLEGSSINFSDLISFDSAEYKQLKKALDDLNLAQKNIYNKTNISKKLSDISNKTTTPKSQGKINSAVQIGNEQEIYNLIHKETVEVQNGVDVQQKKLSILKEQINASQQLNALIGKDGKIDFAKLDISTKQGRAAFNYAKQQTPSLSPNATRQQLSNTWTSDNTKALIKSKDISSKQTEIVDIEKAIGDANTKMAQLLAYRDQVITFIQQLATQFQALNAPINLANNALEKFKKSEVDAANTSLDEVAKDADQVKGSIDGAQKAAENYTETLVQAEQRQTLFSDMQSKISQIFGLANAYQGLTRFVRASWTAIKELDAAFTEIAVVTEFTTGGLWERFDTYNKMAQQLGVTTTDAIETSALYYQQGLDTADVMTLTTETIKMARIANMDFATATQAMTSAIRGFKLEMSDAQTITDTYSALAAEAAVDTDQLATAISKTASIAGSAGLSLEDTSAFLTQIIETTQEAPETAGTALKTIIARFTELKKNPAVLKVDVEGEEVSANKIEEALKTAKVALRDTEGNFRDLDDVFLELSSKWDSLDRNTQRYIATTAAGSRQQSRFIAMMDNYKRTMELVSIANDSAGAGAIQFAKTLDSVSARTNKLKSNFEALIGNLVENDTVKGILDLLNDGMGMLVNASEKGLVAFSTLIFLVGKAIKSALTLVVSQFSNIAKKNEELRAKIGKTIKTTVIYQPDLTLVNQVNKQLKTDPIKVGPDQDIPGTRTYNKLQQKKIDLQDKYNKSYADAIKKRQIYANLLISESSLPMSDSSQFSPELDKARIAAEKARRTVNKDAFKALTPTLVSTVSSGMAQGLAAGVISGDWKVGLATGLMTTISGVLSNPAITKGIGGMLTKSGGTIATVLGSIGGALTKAGPYVAIAAIVAGIGYGLYTWLDPLERANRKLKKAQDNLDKVNNSLESSRANYLSDVSKAKSVSDDIETYKKLSSQVGLTTDEQESLNETVTKLAEQFPQIITGYTEAGQVIIDQKTNWQEILELQKQSIALSQAQYAGDVVASVDAREEVRKSELEVAQQKLDEANKIVEAYATAWANAVTEKIEGEDPVDLNNRREKNYQKALELGKKITSEYQVAYGEVNKLEEQGVLYAQEKAHAYKQIADSLISTYQASTINGNGKVDSQISEIAQNELATRVEGLGLDWDTKDEQVKKDNIAKAQGEADAYLIALQHEFESSNIDMTKVAEHIATDTEEQFVSFLEGRGITAEGKNATLYATLMLDFDTKNAGVEQVLAAISGTPYTLKGDEQEIAVTNPKNYSSEDITSVISKESIAAAVRNKGAQAGADYVQGLYEAVINDGLDAKIANYLASINITTEEAAKQAAAYLASTFDIDYEAAVDVVLRYKNDEDGLINKEGMFSSTGIQSYFDDQQDTNSADQALRTLNTGAIDLTTEQTKALVEEFPELSGALKVFANDAEKGADAIKILKESIAKASNNKKSIEYFKKLSEQIEIIKDASSTDYAKGASKDILKDSLGITDLKDADTLVDTYLSDIEASANGNVDAWNRVQTAIKEARLATTAFGTLTAEEQTSATSAIDDIITKLDLLSLGEYGATFKLDGIDATGAMFQSVIDSLIGVAGSTNNAIKMIEAIGGLKIEPSFEQVAMPINKAGDDDRAVYQKNGGMTTVPTVTYTVTKSNTYNPGYVGGSSGNSGGGSDDAYEVKTDKYYNEINAIEDLTRALDKLTDARENGNLSAEDYQKNVDQTISYYKQLQDTAHNYAEGLRADRAEIVNKILELKVPKAVTVVDGKAVVNKAELDALALTNKTAAESADNLISELDDVDKAIEENIDNWWEWERAQQELADSYRDSFISAEDKIRDVLIKQDQDEIDVLSKKYEKMKEADEDYLEALKDNIDKRRDARDKENDYADLAKKEKRLALLKRDTSGVYGAEILSLEEEIAQTRQDLSDKEVDDMVTNLEEQATKRADSYDKELEELNQRQEDKEKSMVEYNKEVDKIMKSGSENILKWLQTYDEEYLTASKTAQEEYLESWKATINEANSYVDNVSNGTVVTTKEKAASDAQGIYTKLSGMTNTATSKKQDATYATAVSQLQESNATQALAWFSANMTGRAGIDEPTKKLFWDIVLLKHKYEGLGIPEFPGYSEGGIVNTTGLAMVHGTTTKPEAFLSAADTKNFQILMELLNKAVNYNGQTQSDIPTALQIGECQIIVEVGSISDDYDVEQAVDKVKQAIVDNSNYRNVNIVTRKK